MELINRSPFAAGLYPGWGRSGKAQVTVVVKAGFSFDSAGTIQMQNPPPPIVEADQFRGDPAGSSLLAAADTVPFKDGWEFVIAATAYPPTPAARMTEVKAWMTRSGRRRWEKTLRIYGARVWKGGLFGVLPGESEPLTPIPIAYEYAYGGKDPRYADRFEARNPAGTGYSTAGRRLRGAPMPQVELAAKCIATTGDRPDPGGFGPIPSTWMPRAQAFDDLDAPSGPTNGCPYAEKPPAALFNCAPLDQRFVDPIGSSDVLHLKGFFQDLPITETVTLSLPSISVNAAVLDGAHGRPLSLVCDTLLVDCDARTLCLVHRAAIPVRLEDDPAGVVLIR